MSMYGLLLCLQLIHSSGVIVSMVNVTPEHPVIRSNPDLFGQLRDHFSDDEIWILLQTLADSYDMAQDYLPILSAVETVKIDIREHEYNTPIKAYAFPYGDDPYISLTLSPFVKVESLLDVIPDVTTHEVAHMAHAQRNPGMFEPQRVKSGLFISAVIEGVALKTGRQLGAPALAHYHRLKTPQLVNALIDSLYAEYDGDPELHILFLLGDPSYANKGYRVGEYVVTEYFKGSSPTIAEIMDTPIEAFTEFAETKI
jgi:hypothetical protein